MTIDEAQGQAGFVSARLRAWSNAERTALRLRLYESCFSGQGKGTIQSGLIPDRIGFTMSVHCVSRCRISPVVMISQSSPSVSDASLHLAPKLSDQHRHHHNTQRNRCLMSYCNSSYNYGPVLIGEPRGLSRALLAYNTFVVP